MHTGTDPKAKLGGESAIALAEVIHVRGEAAARTLANTPDHDAILKHKATRRVRTDWPRE